MIQKMKLIVLLFVGIFVLISFVNAESYTGSTQVSFSTSFVSNFNISCLSTNFASSWINQTSGNIFVVYNSTYSQGNCSLFKQYYNNQICCPNNYSCDSSTDRCIPSNQLPTCYNQPTRDLCENRAQDLALLTASDPTCFEQSSPRPGCYQIKQCKCQWSTSNGGKCGLNWTLENTCPGGGGYGCAGKTCFMFETSREDKCGEAAKKIIVRYNVTGTATSVCGCVGKTEEFDCQLSVRLPFFGFYNFLAGVLGIFIIYSYSRKIK
jgi:hypothetical protein